MAAGLLILPTLTACTSAYQDFYDSVEYALESYKAEDVVLSAEAIEEFPYSGLYIRRGDNRQALIVLGFIDREAGRRQHSWISADNITIVTENGRIIKTIGQTEAISSSELGNHDILAISNRDKDPLHCIILERQQCPTTYSREIDYLDRNRARSTYAESTFNVSAEQQTITLPRGERNVYYVTETGTFSPSGKTFQNEFWLEADGHVVRSIQHLTPGEKPIMLEQVKWVGRDE